MGLIASIAGGWLLLTLLVYVAWVHGRFRDPPSLRRFAVPGLVCALLLAPGFIGGAHYVLPAPSGIGILVGLLGGDELVLGFNVASFLMVGGIELLVTWLFTRRRMERTRSS